nr:Ig domain OX-2-like protein [Wadden Sea poxvirus]
MNNELLLNIALKIVIMIIRHNFFIKFIYCMLYLKYVYNANCNQYVVQKKYTNTIISCNSSNNTNDALLITWNKINDTNTKIVIYGKSGTVILGNNIEYLSYGFNTTTLLIKNVTLQDGGCYVCVFNFLYKNNDRCKTCVKIKN